MASDRQQYERALEKWHGFHEDGEYSAPSGEGKIAIVSSVTTYTFRDRLSRVLFRECSKSDRTIFNTEAQGLGEVLAEHGHNPKVFLNATEIDMKTVLQDPSFSDIIVIGHGSFSHLSMKKADGGIWYDWRDVSRDSTHLKLGQFVQRHCGHNTMHLPVPLGTFAVASLTQVIAPTGEPFSPDSLTDPINKLLQPVSSKPWLPYDQVIAAFTEA